METLRVRQKVARSDRILEAAELAFRERGFGNSSIGDIALQAGMSERTIYNYFKTKDHILLALFGRHTANWKVVSAELLERLPDEVDEAISTVLIAEIDIALAMFPNWDIWRQLVIISVKWAPETGEELGFYDMARLQAEPLERLMIRLVANGRIDGDEDLAETAWMLYSLSRAVFRDLISEREPDLPRARQLLRQHVRRVVNGLRPLKATEGPSGSLEDHGMRLG